MRILTFILICSLVAAACSRSPATFTEQDSGTEILLESGDRFEVRLEANPSTGYSWEIARSTAPAVELISQDFESADTETVGSPGEAIFEFRSTEGAAVLRLEYLRTFDEPVIAERVVEYIVRVDGADWPPDGSETPGTTTQLASISVADLLNSTPSDAVSVTGFLVWTDAGARLCEALAESFPPQCGGASVVLSNPERLTNPTESEQSTRWTNERIVVTGAFDGTELTIDA